MSQDPVSHEVLQYQLAELSKQVKTLIEKQDQMQQDLSKYKGMWGGIILLLSGITAAGALAISYFKS